MFPPTILGVPLLLAVRVIAVLFGLGAAVGFVKHREHVAYAEATAETNRIWRVKLATAEEAHRQKLKEIGELARKDIEEVNKSHDETKIKLAEVSESLDKVLVGAPSPAWPAPVVTKLRDGARAINRGRRR